MGFLVYYVYIERSEINMTNKVTQEQLIKMIKRAKTVCLVTNVNEDCNITVKAVKSDLLEEMANNDLGYVDGWKVFYRAEDKLLVIG